MAYNKALALGISLFFICAVVGTTSVALADDAVAAAKGEVDDCNKKIQVILEKIKVGTATAADKLKLRDLQWELVDFEYALGVELDRVKASATAPADSGGSDNKAIENVISGIEDSTSRDDIAAQQAEQERIRREQTERLDLMRVRQPGSIDSGGSSGSMGGSTCGGSSSSP